VGYLTKPNKLYIAEARLPPASEPANRIRTAAVDSCGFGPSKIFSRICHNPGVGKTRSRVIAVLVVLVVVATSIALRKTVSDQTIRVAIGIVEVVVIAIVVSRVFGRT